MKRFLIRHRRAGIRLIHLFLVEASLAVSFLLRFDFTPAADDIPLLLQALGLAAAVKTAVFHWARIDHGWWSYAGIADLVRLFWVNAGATVVFALSARLLIGPAFPRSVYCIDLLVCFIACAGARFAVRLYQECFRSPHPGAERRGLLIYGAGTAGLTLLREIRSNPRLGFRVAGFLDDDPGKRGAKLAGVPVVGGGRDAARIVERSRNGRARIDEIVIAMPSATGRQVSEALANCNAAGVPCKTLPGLGELLAGRVLASQIREIAVTDLLGREPVRLEEDRIRAAVAGRSVLVTGGAGSIGAELCRQLAGYQPRTLVVFDQAESDLFRIEMELRRRFPGVEVAPEIGDICDSARIERLMRRHAPSSVFHAAAYKHVPLMEQHLLEAVKNNVLGTHGLVQAARRNGVSTFLMISSDKAVNPTNIMGLTKRAAELVVAAASRPAQGGATRCVSVRFGNVLGSSGSVVPLFRAQIAAGGPVTVTHPDMRRYFMTIPEAVQLVLQASTMGQGAEIFVLNMGEPVRIVDLARNMIKLAGYEPEVDIAIRFTGPRPGEKLFEELAAIGDSMQPTYHEKILIFRGHAASEREMSAWLAALCPLVAREDETAVLAHLHALVPEYQPSGRWVTVPRTATA